MPKEYESNADKVKRLEREDKTIRRPTDSDKTKAKEPKKEKPS